MTTTKFIFISTIAFVLMGCTKEVPMTQDGVAYSGVISKQSPLNFTETVAELENRIAAKGLNLFTVIDHRANATGVGLEIEPTTVIIFGNPNVGTLVMQDKESVAIDFPQKFLITEREGVVSVSYNDPYYLKTRHALSDAVNPVLDKVTGLLDGLSSF